MRHTTGIIQDLDFRPREIIKRERIGGIAKIIAPRFEERLLARPFGGQMDGLVIVLQPCTIRRLTYLTNGKQRAHARAGFRQLLGECGDVNHVMTQTKCAHSTHYQPFNTFTTHPE